MLKLYVKLQQWLLIREIDRTEIMLLNTKYRLYDLMKRLDALNAKQFFVENRTTQPSRAKP